VRRHSVGRPNAIGEAALRVPTPPLARQVLVTGLRTVGLLARHRLHLRRDRVGTAVVLPDGRPYLVFRESSCDIPSLEPDVTLLVRFQLKGTSPTRPWRSWLFERESILNTLLYAGYPGFGRKLWLVDRTTAAYAGLYTWHGRAWAERYADYICAVLRPLSEPGTVTSEITTSELHPGHVPEVLDRDEGPCPSSPAPPTMHP